ncbi:ABC transporter permease [Grimontia sp. AD028]|uniref:ABC transporter permease n=1 Tax=Grimontia sp. AD028 TaxID=1581149 RepID=UPI000695B9F3|nr:ABC transporter permease [Grimontia sp. AD028]
MKSQANKLALSYLWWIIEPLLFVSLFYVLFEYILHRGGDDYFSFMIVGKIVYLWFSKSVTTASTSLVSNKGILSQRAIPKWVFPISNVQECAYKSTISFALLCAILIINGILPTIYWLQLIPLTVITYIFIVSISLLSSILVSVARDFTNLINMGMLGLMFASGIFWDISSINDETLKSLVLYLNPLASVIFLYREVLLESKIIDLSLFKPILIYSVVFMSLSLTIFRSFNNKLTRLIFS